jgi:hypothetical protein
MLGEAGRRSFAEQGFAHLPGVLPADTLGRASVFIDRLMIPEPLERRLVMPSPAGPVVTNLDFLLDWGDPALLELLALPDLMDQVAAICGPDFFPVQEFAVIKHPGDGLPVLWHRDMPNRRSGPACTLGIYLDESLPGHGALRFVPGSHLSDDPIEAIAQLPAIEVPARAGDAIMHDMLTAHSSSAMTAGARRRVIYLEFLSVALAQAEALYPPEFIAGRQRLMYAAQRYRSALCPGEPCFAPDFADPAPGDQDRCVVEVLREVHDTQVRPQPAKYAMLPLASDLA